jgi:hypothetical protein
LAENTNRQIEQIIDDMTLFDDDLMSLVFDGNLEATELLLRIILEKEDIKVISVVGQRELENPIVSGRNIRLDILAQDSTGKYFDIEVQRGSEGAHFKRARFHSSMLDVRLLEQKQRFKELPEAYVIFITERDIIGRGLPLYHINRKIEELGESFADGSHIIYVNGSYKGEDALGKLMHDFRCKKVEDIYYPELAQGVGHFKKNEGGKKQMCDAVKEFAVEYAKEKAETIAIKLLKDGKYNLEEIANMTDLSISHVRLLQEKIHSTI